LIISRPPRNAARPFNQLKRREFIGRTGDHRLQRLAGTLGASAFSPPGSRDARCITTKREKPAQPDRRITIATAGLLVSRKGSYRVIDDEQNEFLLAVGSMQLSVRRGRCMKGVPSRLPSHYG
jgi:hypothetical protein